MNTAIAGPEVMSGTKTNTGRDALSEKPSVTIRLAEALRKGAPIIQACPGDLLCCLQGNLSTLREATGSAEEVFGPSAEVQYFKFDIPFGRLQDARLLPVEAPA